MCRTLHRVLWWLLSKSFSLMLASLSARFFNILAIKSQKTGETSRNLSWNDVMKSAALLFDGQFECSQQRAPLRSSPPLQDRKHLHEPGGRNHSDELVSLEILTSPRCKDEEAL